MGVISFSHASMITPEASKTLDKGFSLFNQEKLKTNIIQLSLPKLYDFWMSSFLKTLFHKGFGGSRRWDIQWQFEEKKSAGVLPYHQHMLAERVTYKWCRIREMEKGKIIKKILPWGCLQYWWDRVTLLTYARKLSFKEEKK